MRYSDKPIDRPQLDLLGRASFALSLARAIDQLAVARDGFVIGVQGEWGSGKTSLIEMMCRYLRHVEMERVSKLPLDWEDTSEEKGVNELENMIQTFERVEAIILDLDKVYRFQGGIRTERDARWREIRRHLASDEEADIADRYWRLRQRADTGMHTIVVRFSPWLITGSAELSVALLADLARAIGEEVGDDIRQAFGALLTRISEFAPVVGTGLDAAVHGWSLGAFSRAGSALSASVGAKLVRGPTVQELRDRLRFLLSNLSNKKILVIIDDLDRLTATDALQIVSVVKSLGDLPNVVYLLAYDEEKLNELITVTTGTNGHEFLEKIVQYPVRLPPIELGDLARMLDADLDGLLPTFEQQDQLRLQTAWIEIISQYVKTPRDVKRLVNSFIVAFSAMIDYTDAIDLLVMECFRLYEPIVYTYICNNIADLWD